MVSGTVPKDGQDAEESDEVREEGCEEETGRKESHKERQKEMTTTNQTAAREALIAAFEAPIRARAERSRTEAARWHWVTEAWYTDRTPLWMRKLLDPERFIIEAPNDMMLQQVRTMLYADIPTRHHLGYVAR